MGVSYLSAIALSGSLEIMGGKFLIFFAFYLCIGTVAAKKFNKVKYNSTGINDANSVLKTLAPLIDQLQVDIARLQECVATPYDDPNWENVCILPPEDRSNIERKGVSRAKDRSTMATTLDVIFVGSMYLNSVDRCGVTQLTNCAVTIDNYVSNTATSVTANGQTNAGSCIFTAPIGGYYNICFHARFKGSGNSNDVTIQAGGTTYAGAFGDADTRDWRSTGTCFIALLAATNTVYATHRSGGGQDCVEETGWRYGVFSVHLVVPTA